MDLGSNFLGLRLIRPYNVVRPRFPRFHYFYDAFTWFVFALLSPQIPGRASRVQTFLANPGLDKAIRLSRLRQGYDNMIKITNSISTLFLIHDNLNEKFVLYRILIVRV